MSVQAGIVNFDSSPVNTELMDGLNTLLASSGPDGDQCYMGSGTAMLFRPFHTTAEARLENQPYQSRRGFIITWDGRLDNRDELIASLGGSVGIPPTDVTVVAAAFDKWETDSFRRLIGDWAVSIWDPRQRALLFAVDYMAIRHIFYYRRGSQVIWATDLAPLVLLSNEQFHIDDDYIAGYFAHDPDSHVTPYREIREVPAGKFVQMDARRVLVERHWRFKSSSRILYKTDTEYEAHFRHLFRQSVRRRLRSHFPVLAELSGGLDSSSIVCMADDILAKEGAQTSRLDTISYYDKTEPNGDDWMYFPHVEKKRGRKGIHIDASTLGTAPAALDLVEFSPLPGYMPSGRHLEEERAKAIRQGGYRAVLSGIGGDEFLGGIPNPVAQLGDLIIQMNFIELARQLMAWSIAKRRPWIHLLGQACVNLLPAFLGQYVNKQATLQPWVDRRFAKRAKIARRLLDVDEHLGLWLPARRSYIAGILLMANKLAKWKSPAPILEETRYPYLDQNLIEFILSIPANQLLRPGERRSLMRRSLAGLVPGEILSRKTKQFGARTPIIGLENNLRQLRMAFDSPLSSRLGFIDHEQLLTAVDAARDGKRINVVQLIRAISLELWLKDLASRNTIAVPPPSSLRYTARMAGSRV